MHLHIALTRANRVEIGKQLINIQPRKWRNDAASDLTYDGPESPYVARQCTLRKIREEAIVRELGINKDLDPINSLCELKYKGQYAEILKRFQRIISIVFTGHLCKWNCTKH